MSGNFEEFGGQIIDDLINEAVAKTDTYDVKYEVEKLNFITALRTRLENKFNELPDRIQVSNTIENIMTKVTAFSVNNFRNLFTQPLMNHLDTLKNGILHHIQSGDPNMGLVLNSFKPDNNPILIELDAYITSMTRDLERTIYTEEDMTLETPDNIVDAANLELLSFHIDGVRFLLEYWKKILEQVYFNLDHHFRNLTPESDQEETLYYLKNLDSMMKYDLITTINVLNSYVAVFDRQMEDLYEPAVYVDV